MPLRTGALVALMLLVATQTHAADADSRDLPELVSRQMQWSRLPAVAVVVTRAEGEVAAVVPDRNGTGLSADTPFLIGSVTKTFTALAIAQLVDAGRLRFDDPVFAHLSGDALAADDRGRTLTLRHLLTHTSGLSQWSGHDRRAQTEGRFDHIAPARSPGLEVEYSSLNYILLGKVVAAASGLDYGTYLRRHVFEPLEMKNSFAEMEAARAHGLVQGHWFLFGLAIPGRETQQPAPLVPAGFVISSARDLGHFLSMLLGEGRFRGRQVVRSETLREMFRPWDGSEAGAGMGWGVSRTRIGHSGSTPTFSARLALLPEQGYGVVVLTNVNSGPFFSGTAQVMEGVVARLRGQPAPSVRPDEILLKLGILLAMGIGAIRSLRHLRPWARRGFPHRLSRSSRVLGPLVVEIVGAVVVLVVIPRWIGVPLQTLVEYFPDLALAMLVSVATGLPGGLVQSFLRADETV